MSEWIKCSDRLPEIDIDNWYSKICLVTDGKDIGLASRYKEDEYDDWSSSYYIGTDVDINKITHWMPLPKLNDVAED